MSNKYAKVTKNQIEQYIKLKTGVQVFQKHLF